MSNGRFATSGIRFAVTMTLYSAGMFVLGFTRGDAVPMLGAWRLDQVIDAGIVAVGMRVYPVESCRSDDQSQDPPFHP